MNRWLQTRTFHCQSCQTEYLHDLAYKHRLFECPARPRAAKAMSLDEPDDQIVTGPMPAVVDFADSCGWRW